MCSIFCSSNLSFQCSFLIDYCSNFVRRNLDGVLNVGKKSVMNQYLNDMLADSLHQSGERYRDDHHHPLIMDVITAGNKGKPTFDREWFSTTEEWIQGCTELTRSPVVQRILADVTAREYEEDIKILRNRPRGSSSCASDYELSRKRSASFASDQGAINEPESRKSILDECIKNTANMDLSTSRLASDKSIWLAKEMRGVRKKLSQIVKLQESETKSIVLSTEQRAKVDRRQVLEAELTVYETALDEVERRIKEMSSEEKERKSRKSSKEQGEKKGLQSADDSQTAQKGTLEKDPSFEEKLADKSYTCEICGIKCPDKNSYELHKNGRKHRNRVAQVAEEEKEKAAKSILEQHQLEQVKSTAVFTRPSEKKAKNAWGVPSGQPKYKLPPPPHPAVAQVAPASQSPRKASSPKVLTPATPKISSMASPAASFDKILRERGAKAKSPKAKSSTPLTSSPMWASPSPGSTRCVPLNIYSASDLTPAPSTADGAQRNSYSLADFLAPKPTPKGKAAGAAWSSPKAAKPTSSTKSLAEIQSDEVDFKTRQDHAYGKGGGTWFIERRERADSLHAIQELAVNEREEQLLIEEQKAVEAQIQEELALHRQKEKKEGSSAKKQAPRRKNKKRQNAVNSSGGDKGPSAQTKKSGGKEPEKPGNPLPKGPNNRPKTRNRKGGKSGTQNKPTSNSQARNEQGANEVGSSGRKNSTKFAAKAAAQVQVS
jgi:hypothetical protein